MKKFIAPAFAAMALLGFVACNDADEKTETTVDSSTSSTVTETSGTMTNMEGVVDPNPNTSYVDLSSGTTIKVRRDTITRYIINEETTSPVMYYFDPATNDTFDRSGRVVNNALLKGPDGSWTIDESRIKVKMQDDGDVKMKDKDSDDKVKLETNGDAKIKTDTSKTKIKDGKIKEKKN